MATKNTEVTEAPKNDLAPTPVNSSFEIDPEDIDIPRINVTQKMSQSDSPVGSVVYDKTYAIAEPETPLDVIPVAAQKGWREDIPFDDDDVPRIAWNKEQADTIRNDSEYEMTEFAEITLLVKQPADCDEEAAEAFQIPLGDSNYALGKINVAKNAYRSTFKRLATFAALNSGVPLSAKVWAFSSESITRGKYTWFTPNLVVTKNVPDAAAAEFVTKFAG